MKDGIHIPPNIGILQKLYKLSSRADDPRAFLNTHVFNMYKEAQAKRWMTENKSEGDRWKKLSPNYRKWKEKKYAKFPGGGKKLMIATNTLSRAAMGRDASGFRKIVTKNRLTISISTDKIKYASDVAKFRPYMKFGDKTKEKIKKAMIDWIKSGKIPGGSH